MNTTFRLLLVFVSASLTAHAAATVEEGIAAFHAGEYPKAVELLKPHADDGVAQRHLALMYDKNYHVLWDFSEFEHGAPIYTGGVDFDDDVMEAHYTRAIELGDIIGRWHYCEWTHSMVADNRKHIRNSRCKNKRFWYDMRRYAQERYGDPVVSYYDWMSRSGELGTRDRRIRARRQLMPKAQAGDSLYQLYLARVYMGFNARRDRPADLANAYFWFAASSMGGNYRAKAMQTYLRRQLEQAGQLECIEPYAIDMLNNLLAKQNDEPAPNATTEASQSCNDPVFELN